MKKKIIAISTLVIVLLGYFSLGIFVVQPMGAIPDGGSVLYVRLGTNLDFFESPDSLSEKSTGKVSLFGRAMAAVAFMKNIENKIIIKLPYFNIFYFLSTGGTEYEK